MIVQEIESDLARGRVRLMGHSAAAVVASQLRVFGWLMQPSGQVPEQPRRFRSQEKLWRAVFRQEITEHCHLELDGFYLSEWLPWRPGLCHTDQAKWGEGVVTLAQKRPGSTEVSGACASNQCRLNVSSVGCWVLAVL